MDSQRAGQGNWATIDALLEIFTMEQVGQITEAARAIIDSDSGYGEIGITFENHHPHSIVSKNSRLLARPK